MTKLLFTFAFVIFFAILEISFGQAAILCTDPNGMIYDGNIQCQGADGHVTTFGVYRQQSQPANNAADEPWSNGGGYGSSLPIDQSPSDQKSPEDAAYADCVSAHDAAENYCLAQQLAAPIAAQLAAYKSQMNSGDTKAACKTAKQAAFLSASANIATSVLCVKKSNACITACESQAATQAVADGPSATALAKSCKESKNFLAVSAALQGMQSLQAFGQSKLCEEAASGKCIGENAYNDSDCMQYCMKPGRQNDPKCRVAMASCTDPQYAAQNAQYCSCLRNPTGQGCSNIIDPPTPNLADGLPQLDGNLGGDEFGQPDNKPGGSSANNDTRAGGSGGAALGSGSSSPVAGTNGNNATGDEPKDKDILNGYGGSNGGGFGYGGGGGGYGTASGGSGRSGDSDSGIDLRSFLPGQKNDPRRNPASMLGYADRSITSANGLTNFQKITRKMNQKRPELMP